MKGEQRLARLVVVDAVCCSGMGMGWASPGASDRILASEEHGTKKTLVMMACTSVCGRSGARELWNLVWASAHVVVVRRKQGCRW